MTPSKQRRAATVVTWAPARSMTIVTVAAALLVAGCAASATPSVPPSAAAASPATSPPAVPTEAPAPTSAPTPSWHDATAETIGATGEWTNKVELADIDADGDVDILFANGGEYESPGTPVPSRVYRNEAPGGPFTDVTEQVFGDLPMLARVIKVRDIDADGVVDILVGTTYQTHSQLLLGRGDGTFENVTEQRLPNLPASIGDLELGDVDADGDLDVVLADWGVGSPMQNSGGPVRLWLNDGNATLSDVTSSQMPETLVGFSWDLELIDVDGDWDLDVATSCKVCQSSLLYINDGTGTFTDVTARQMPHFGNNYDFAAMDIDADGDLDLATINDGPGAREHLFVNDGRGTFTDASEDLMSFGDNPGYDDNVATFLDADSDGDADLLVASLDGPDRLLRNGGSGVMTLDPGSTLGGAPTTSTLGMGVADLDGDGRLDVVETQGEVPGIDTDHVYLGTDLPPDGIAPVVRAATAPGIGGVPTVHAWVHDRKSSDAPHDYRQVILRVTVPSGTVEVPLTWYGEYLYRAAAPLPPEATDVEVCATDTTGNVGCAPLVQ